MGLYHLAWEVDTLADVAEIRERLSEEGALVGASDHATTKALCGRDPDGIDFEVAWLVPADLITLDVVPGSRALDLTAGIARLGKHTPGDVGVSRPRLVGV